MQIFISNNKITLIDNAITQSLISCIFISSVILNTFGPGYILKFDRFRRFYTINRPEKKLIFFVNLNKLYKSLSTFVIYTLKHLFLLLSCFF